MSNLYTRIIKLVLISYLFINAVIWALSPTLVDHYLSEFLVSKKLTLTDDSSIRYNPFISQIQITDLSINVASSQPSIGEVISIPSATLEFSLFKLFAKKVVIEKFDINGLQADVGLALMHLNSLPPEGNAEIAETKALETDPELAATDIEKPDENGLMSFTFEMPSLNMTHSKVLFDLAGDQQSIELEQFILSDMLVSQRSQSAEVSIALLYNKALFELDANLKLNNGIGELQYALDLQELNLAHFASFITQSLNDQYQGIEGLLSVKTEQYIAFNKADISSQIQDVNLVLSELSLNQQRLDAQGVNPAASGLSFNIGKLAIQDGVIDVSLPHSLADLLNSAKFQPINVTDELILRSNLSLEQSDLLIKLVNNSGTSSTELVKLAKLSIPEIDVVLENSQAQVQVNKVELDNITAANTQAISDTDSSESIADLPLLNILKLSFNDIKASNHGLKIDSIDITSVNAAITKQQDGKIAQLESLLAASEPASTTTANQNTTGAIEDTRDSQSTKSEDKSSSEDDKPTEPFTLYIGKVSLQDKLSFAITDSSVTPSYQNIILIDTLSIAPIDNATPSVTSKVQVLGSLDQYSKFDIQADIKPFSKDKYIKADITVTEFDLSTITTYLKDFMAIESGHLHTVTNFIIDGDIINGNAKLNLSRVELAEAVEYDQENSIDTLIPVNVALSMLKDGQGNIELDVPVEGSLDAPDFRLSGFMALLIQRATMSATQKYLINAFVPYANIIQIGMQAGDFILKVRFQDLILATGEDELPKSADVFLKQFAALMLDKKSTQITVCAMSTKADIGVEHSEKLTSKQLDKLNQLSLNRMKNFKRYMVETHEIESGRLLLCAPKIDISKNAKPRLTFTN